MAKNEKTSKRVGKIASQQLRSKRTSKKAKSTAASALTQRASQVKSSARIGGITRRTVRSVVKRVSNTRNRK